MAILLPIIAVMFTFSFNTAFAAVGGGTTPTYTHDEAVAKAQADLIKAFTENAASAKAAIAKETEYKEVFGDFTAHIPASFYADAVDLLVADYTRYVNEATSKWMETNSNSNETNPDAIKSEIMTISVNNIYVLANNKFDVTNSSFPATANGIKELVLAGINASDDLTKYYQMQIWASALDTMKNEAKAELAKVDFNLYTDDVIPGTDYKTLEGTTNAYKVTWKAYAQGKVDKMTDEINKVSINPTKDLFGKTKTEIGKLWKVVAAAGAQVDGIVKEDTVTDINGNEIIISYKLANTNIKTAEDLKGTAVDKDAEKAADKAAIQSEAASLLKKALAAYKTEYAAAGNAAAKKTVADNYKKAQDMINAWTTVNLYLVDVENSAKDLDVAVEATINPTLAAIIADDDLVKALAKVELYEKAQELAAAYKLAVDKDGALRFDAATIDSNLADLKESVFDGTVKNETGVIAALLDGAEAGATDATPWLKEVAVAQVKKALEATLYNADGSDKYYEAEKAKVQAKYDELLAKIEAATTKKQLEVVLGTANYNVLTSGTGSYNFVNTTGIDDKTAVKTAIKALGNFGAFKGAVNNSITYLNWGIKAYEDGYRAPLTADDDNAVANYLAKNEVRTYSELAAKMALAKEYAETVATKGEKKAAQAEFDAMIKALPSIVKFEHKEQIAKAWAFADENGLTSAKLNQAVALVKAAEQKEIDKLFNALPTTIKVENKEAVKTLIAAVDAYSATAMYEYPTDKDYTAEFEALRAAEKAEVEKQVALLPVDTSKASLEKVQAAVDAFVKEYKDASYGKVGYEAVLSDAAADRLSFAKAYVAAKEIKAVESMKLRAYSKYAKKGITVKWVIEDGRKSDAAGYQVWRSTKSNSGYKKLITVKGYGVNNAKNLKKGTTYYYKVRAYKRVEGKLYFSDWSNKAYRKAK